MRREYMYDYIRKIDDDSKRVIEPNHTRKMGGGQRRRGGDKKERKDLTLGRKNNLKKENE